MSSKGWTKLDSGITRSTLWMQPHDVLRVWIAMLAESDAYGVVRAAAPAMAYLCQVDMDRFLEIIEYLKAPDPFSRSKELEGRRLEEVEGGWVVVNYIAYRELMQGKAASTADRSKRYRDRLRDREATVTRSHADRVATLEEEAEEEAEAEAGSKAKAETRALGEPLNPEHDETVANLYALWEAHYLDAKGQRYIPGTRRQADDVKALMMLVSRGEPSEVISHRMRRYLESTRKYYVDRSWQLVVLADDWMQFAGDPKPTRKRPVSTIDELAR